MLTEAELKTQAYKRYRSRDSAAWKEFKTKLNDIEARGYDGEPDHPLQAEAERIAEAYQQARRIAWLDYKAEMGQETKE